LATTTDGRTFLERIAPPPRRRTGTSRKITVQDDAYIKAAVNGELDLLSSTGAGGRNNQLNVSALKLARLPADREALREWLIDACHTNGLIADDGIGSVEATIDSAFGKADADGPRDIPERASSPPLADAGIHVDVDGAALLDDLLAALTRFVAFPDQYAAAATTLWIATTHALPAFECAPRLVATSPGKRCGKSRLLDIITATCHQPLTTVNASTAAVFRSIAGEHPPTLIIDEADTLFGNRRVAEQNEDLRALLNAGHQRGRPALRCVGPDQTPTPFATFAMAALAGIGRMPDTITDRAVNFTMRRRAPDEQVATFRSRRDGPPLEHLRQRLAAWATHHTDALTVAEPAMPVEDRAADTWEPLIALADEAGGDWPDVARSACTALASIFRGDWCGLGLMTSCVGG